MTEHSGEAEPSATRRRLLKAGLIAGSAAPLAGCPGLGRSDDGSESDGKFTGRVTNIRDEGVQDALVVAMATVETENVYDNRVIAQGKTDTQGRFSLPVTNLDAASERVVSHANGPDIVLLAQYDAAPGLNDVATGIDDIWIATAQISGSAGSDGRPAVPGLESNHTLVMNQQVLSNGWGTSLTASNYTVWRTIPTETPSEQSLAIEVRGDAAHLVRQWPNNIPYHPVLDKGTLEFQIPDDDADTIEVSYPSDQDFNPSLAMPVSNDGYNKWFNATPPNFLTYPLPEAFQAVRSEAFAPPLYAFFDGAGFAPLTEADREAFESVPSQLDQVDDDLVELFIKLTGEPLGDIGVAISALSLSEGLVSYTLDALKPPASPDDKQFAGNDRGPETDQNIQDLVSAAWPSLDVNDRPPAVVHEIDVDVDIGRERNPHPIRARGVWRINGSLVSPGRGARLEDGYIVDFERLTPGAPTEQSTGTESSSTATSTTSDPPSVFGQWRQTQADAANTGRIAGGGPDRSPDLAWTYDADAGSNQQYSGQHYGHVVDGDTLYACTEDGPVVAVDLATGSERWRVTPHSLTPEGLAFGADTLYMTMSATTGTGAESGASDPAVYALSRADGMTKWTWDFPEVEVTGGYSGIVRPTLTDDTLYVFAVGADGVGTLAAVDIERETHRWITQFERVSDDYIKYVGAPAVGDGRVYLSTYSGLHAFDATSGAIQWTAPGGETAVTVRDGLVLTTRVPEDSYVFGLAAYNPSASGNDRLAWFGLTDGEFAVNSNVGWAVRDGTVYVSDEDGLLYAVDNATGKRTRWESPYRADSNGFMTSVLAADDTVYFGFTYGEIHAVDAANGTARFVLGDDRLESITSSPIVTNGRLYTGGDRIQAWHVPDR